MEVLEIQGKEPEVGRLRREAVLSRRIWKEQWREVMATRLSLPETGIRLEGFLLRRPGRRGEFLRVFPSCRVAFTPSAGQRWSRESMPLPIVEETPAEALWHTIEEVGRGDSREGELKVRLRGPVRSLRKEKRRRLKDEAGFEAWVWLVVMVASFMFCGGEQRRRRRPSTWEGGPGSRR